jgi:hypothetical protein
VALTTREPVAVTGEDETSGTVNKALALLTRYFPTELVAPYGAITAVLPEIKPTKETIAEFAARKPPSHSLISLFVTSTSTAVSTGS